MNSELAKLNTLQRRRLRELFAGRTADALHVDAEISKATIKFGPATHYVILGPRGGVISHEIQSNRTPDMKFEIINYRPSRNYAVAQRDDGRQYDVEIRDGRVMDVFALGLRRISVAEKPIGIEIAAETQGMIARNVAEFFLHDGTRKSFEEDDAEKEDCPTP